MYISGPHIALAPTVPADRPGLDRLGRLDRLGEFRVRSGGECRLAGDICLSAFCWNRPATAAATRLSRTTQRHPLRGLAPQDLADFWLNSELFTL